MAKILIFFIKNKNVVGMLFWLLKIKFQKSKYSQTHNNMKIKR